MIDMLEQLRTRCHPLPSQNNSLREWKKQGKKVLGYTCCNIPEEIIYAAGVLPVRLLGSSEALTHAYHYVPASTCYFSRSCLDLGLRGEYQQLDGVVITYGCDTCYELFYVMEEYAKLPFNHLLIIPNTVNSENALTFLVKELTHFKECVEELAGVEITEQALRQTIEIFNQNRAWLKQVYDLRARGFLSGRETAEIARASMLMPKEEHNQILARLVKQVPRRRDLPGRNSPGVHLSGSILPDLELFELVEECGGAVVSDDLCIGSRYFWQTVDNQLHPMEGLARYLLEKVPCPFIVTAGATEKRLDHILKMMRQHGATGVIFALQRYCDPHQFDVPFLSEELKSRGIPVLIHEVEQDIAASRLKPQLEALMEIIQEKRQ